MCVVSSPPLLRLPRDIALSRGHTDVAKMLDEYKLNSAQLVGAGAQPTAAMITAGGHHFMQRGADPTSTAALFGNHHIKSVGASGSKKSRRQSRQNTDGKRRAKKTTTKQLAKQQQQQQQVVSPSNSNANQVQVMIRPSMIQQQQQNQTGNQQQQVAVVDSLSPGTASLSSPSTAYSDSTLSPPAVYQSQFHHHTASRQQTLHHLPHESTFMNGQYRAFHGGSEVPGVGGGGECMVTFQGRGARAIGSQQDGGGGIQVTSHSAAYIAQQQKEIEFGQLISSQQASTVRGG